MLRQNGFKWVHIKVTRLPATCFATLRIKPATYRITFDLFMAFTCRERERGGGGEKGKEGEGMGEEGRGRDVVLQRQHYQFHDSHVHALHSTGNEEKSLMIRDRAKMQ